MIRPTRARSCFFESILLVPSFPFEACQQPFGLGFFAAAQTSALLPWYHQVPWSEPNGSPLPPYEPPNTTLTVPATKPPIALMGEEAAARGPATDAAGWGAGLGSAGPGLAAAMGDAANEAVVAMAIPAATVLKREFMCIPFLLINPPTG